MKYQEAIRHPRWQKRRLEKMQSVGFKCENCGNTEIELQIHHTFYDKDRKPWEYTLSELRCWCTDCHKQHHKSKPIETGDSAFNPLLEEQFLLPCPHCGGTFNHFRYKETVLRNDRDIGFRLYFQCDECADDPNFFVEFISISGSTLFEIKRLNGKENQFTIK